MVRPADVLKWILRNTKTIGITIAGGVLVLAGIAMLVLPGPGLLVIVAGLAVLATQYTWAQVALEKTRERARKAGRGARRALSRRKGSRKRSA
jgi:uncharacterized protein (TIGR02611 family)